MHVFEPMFCFYLFVFFHFLVANEERNVKEHKKNRVLLKQALVLNKLRWWI